MPALQNTTVTELRTLGGLRLEASDFGRTKPLLLLSYLCLEGPQARRRVAELFWPEAKDPLASLATDISRLKKACGAVLGADDRKVWAAVRTDAEGLLGALEHDELQQAVARYEGPFLAAVYLRDWPAELEGWVYSTREFLAARVCEAHVRLGEAAAKGGDFGAGARCAERACAVPGSGGLEPELIPRVYALLAADARSHRTTVRAAVKRAGDEFGLALTLSPAQARAQLRPTARPLLTRRAPFIGREAELRWIGDLLGQEVCRLLSVVGIAGMGKTRLAVEAANRTVREGHWDGVYLAELESLAAASGLPYQVADALSVELKGDASPPEAVAAAVGNKRVLLLLDNIEHLLDGVTFLSELLRRCPNLKLLVTSRERLNLAEEHVLWLEGLPFHAGVEGGPHPDALALFLERARRHRQTFEPTPEDLSAVARICRTVAGSPLALELAAALVNTLSCGGIAGYLAQDAISLSSRARDLPSRQSSMRAALGSTWRLLEEDEKGALMRLAVFRGGFTRDAALEVVNVGLSLLVTLSDKALLRPQPNGRFDRHPLVYEFTKQKLLECPGLAEAERRKHANYFTTFLEDRLKTIRGEQAKTVLKEISSDLDNIRGAWDDLLEQGQAAELAKGVFTLAYFFEFTGRCEEGLDLFSNTAGRLGALPSAPLALGKTH